MSHIHNIISLIEYSKKFSRSDKFKKHHAHCVTVQAYDNLYKRQLKLGADVRKISS